MKGSILVLSVFVAFLLTLNSCKKLNEETLVQDAYCALDTISYNNHVKPIINQRCMPCHNGVNQSGGFILDNHTDLSSTATSGTLLGVIRHEAGYLEMPRDAQKMPDCEISVIEKWIAQGALNN